jgi:hypothetical protein
VGAGNFFLHHCIPLASYPMGTRSSFPGVKQLGCEADHSLPSSAKVSECVELYLHAPNTPSWCVAQLKTQEQLIFLLVFQGLLNLLPATSETHFFTYICVPSFDAVQQENKSLNNIMYLICVLSLFCGLYCSNGSRILHSCLDHVCKLTVIHLLFLALASHLEAGN